MREVPVKSECNLPFLSESVIRRDYDRNLERNPIPESEYIASHGSPDRIELIRDLKFLIYVSKNLHADECVDRWHHVVVSTRIVEVQSNAVVSTFSASELANSPAEIEKMRGCNDHLPRGWGDSRKEAAKAELARLERELKASHQNQGLLEPDPCTNIPNNLSYGNESVMAGGRESSEAKRLRYREAWRILNCEEGRAYGLCVVRKDGKESPCVSTSLLLVVPDGSSAGALMTEEDGTFETELVKDREYSIRSDSPGLKTLGEIHIRAGDNLQLVLVPGETNTK